MCAHGHLDVFGEEWGLESIYSNSDALMCGKVRYTTLYFYFIRHADS